MKLKIKKGDTVRVIAGNDKGREGRVLNVLPSKMRILVEGVNIRKRHMRPTQTTPNGSIVERTLPIHYSNVMIIDAGGNTTRIGVKSEEVGEKRTRVRIALSTGDPL